MAIFTERRLTGQHLAGSIAWVFFASRAPIADLALGARSYEGPLNFTPVATEALKESRLLSLYPQDWRQKNPAMLARPSGIRPQVR